MPALDPQGQDRAGPGLPARRRRAAAQRAGGGDHPVRRPRGRDVAPGDRAGRGVGRPARASSLTVIGDAGVGKSRLVREFAGRAGRSEHSQVLRGRCLPVWRWRHVLADRRDRPRRRGHCRRGSARGGTRQDHRTSPEGRRVPTTIQRWSSIASRRRSACPRPRFPAPELFWGIRKLLEAIATPATARRDRRRHPRGRADVPRAPRSPARERPRRADPAADHGSPRAPRDAHRMGRGARVRPDDPGSPLRRRVRQHRRAPARRARRGRPRADHDRGRGQPALCRTDHRDADRDRRHPPGWRCAGSRPADRASIAIPPTIQALVAARLDALRARTARSSIRPRSSAWASPSKP